MVICIGDLKLVAGEKSDCTFEVHNVHNFYLLEKKPRLNSKSRDGRTNTFLALGDFVRNDLFIKD